MAKKEKKEKPAPPNPPFQGEFTPDPLPKGAKGKKFLVSIPFNPKLEVEAVDKDSAVLVYNKACGILSTTHVHHVEELG